MTVKVSKPAINIREGLADLHKPSGTAGEAMLKAETPQEQFNLISAGRRRLNHNGAMTVFQKGSGLTGGDGPDRYGITNTAAGTITTTKDADVPPKGGFSSSLKIACSSATGINSTTSVALLIHRMEGTDSQCTNFGKPTASPLTLSFWVKSNRAGPFNVNFENELPIGGGADRGYQTKQILNQADTWEYKVVTIEGDSVAGMGFTNNNLKGLCFEISLSKAGSAYGGGTPQSNWNNLSNNQRSVHNLNFFGDSTDNYWKITGVQLELGKIATPFEHRSFGEELALCQRYYYQHVKGTDQFVGMGDFYSATQIDVMINLPVSMRATPSITQTTGTNFYLHYSAGVGRYVNGAWTLWKVNPANTVVSLYATPASNGVAGYAARVLTYNAGSSIALKAEL